MTIDLQEFAAQAVSIFEANNWEYYGLDGDATPRVPNKEELYALLVSLAHEADSRRSAVSAGRFTVHPIDLEIIAERIDAGDADAAANSLRRVELVALESSVILDRLRGGRTCTRFQDPTLRR